MKTSAKIYFRDINRIHINRFKAYHHIIAERLKHAWEITDNISCADAVASYHDQKNHSLISLSLYDSPPNLNPPALDQFILIFEENKLIKQLNDASRQLKLNSKRSTTKNQTTHITVCGKAGLQTSIFCDLLNQLNVDKNLTFTYTETILDADNIQTFEHLLVVVSPDIPDSREYLTYIELLRSQFKLSTNELTVVVNNNHKFSESVFDNIYDTCDESTQVALLDIRNEEELESFIQLFSELSTL